MTEQSMKNAQALGVDTLLWQTQEECGELIKAIAKYNRTRGIGQKTPTTKEEALNSLVEELADVSITIEQVKYLLGLNDDVNLAIEKALNKVSERYSVEVNNEDRYEKEEIIKEDNEEIKFVDNLCNSCRKINNCKKASVFGIKSIVDCIFYDRDLDREEMVE